MNFLLSLLISSNVAQAENIEHLRVASWETRVPNIILCNSSTVDLELVKKAIDAWSLRGERFGDVIEKQCIDQPSRGEIVIYTSDNLTNSQHHGETIRSVFLRQDGTFGTDINYAKIYIRSEYSNTYSLIEHELGHAVGFKDTNDRSSVMSAMGFDH
jgi:predicted Zn-dependent protease